MRRKHSANADHFPTEQMCIAYVEGRVEEEADKHVAARLRQEAGNPFTMAKEVFAVLFKACGDTNSRMAKSTETIVVTGNPTTSLFRRNGNNTNTSTSARANESRLPYPQRIPHYGG